MIHLFKSSINQDDINAVNKVMERQTEQADGPELSQFETEIINFTGLPGALVCNSGTSALHMAMLACRIHYGQEVIVPSFTFKATVACVKFVNAIPVYADIEPETYGLDPEDVERKITDKTKAIIAVHYAGHPCRIKELKQIAFDKKLYLIEDCAESMGSAVNGKLTGTFGSCSIFSFCQNKIITTGDGGAFVTDNPILYRRVEKIATHGNEEYFGYNWRMPSMNAALGISQIKRIREIIHKRQQVASWYNELLPKEIQPIVRTDHTHVYQLYTIHHTKRDRIMRRLNEQGIGNKVYFHPLHQMNPFKSDVKLPVTEQISKEFLSLPMYPDLTQSEVEQICEAVKEALC